MTVGLKAPFPWPGGKSRVAPLVWERFGNVSNYVEPFFGSGAVLLGRPGGASGVETINDKDGFVANFWRAITLAPDETWSWADGPVNEADLHARHLWCMSQLDDSFVERLMGDPTFCDPQLAGWWVWGLSAWIGSGWCSGNGPWTSVDGILTKAPGQGLMRQMPAIGPGKGIFAKTPDLHGTGKGMHRLEDRPSEEPLFALHDTEDPAPSAKPPKAHGGVKRQKPHLSAAGMGAHAMRPHIDANPFQALAERLRNVRVCCGSWERICGPTPTYKQGATAVFLDPPYAVSDRETCYRVEDWSVAHQVRDWCIENGGNPLLRIALCGYDTEHAELADHGWTVLEWKSKGGYGSQSNKQGRANAVRERVWFSPHCVTPDAQLSAF